MKKTYIVLILLITFAFLTACTDKEDTLNCIPKENMKEECASYCTPTVCNQTTAPPAVPEAPPMIVPPNSISDKTTFSNPIPNIGTAIIDREKNSITIRFLNNKNTTILLPLTGSASKYSTSECKNPQITAIYKGESVKALVTQIEKEDEFTVTWDCENLAEVPAAGTVFSADLRFDYKIETGMVYTELGTVIGRY